ncbi:MAG TPA: hypothetical protein VK469_15760 [Candidatus Kapabacteria bacterium]|nr:hypothetical protein [Candidatus Kapabacteria bacterium]
MFTHSDLLDYSLLETIRSDYDSLEYKSQDGEIPAQHSHPLILLIMVQTVSFNFQRLLPLHPEFLLAPLQRLPMPHDLLLAPP